MSLYGEAVVWFHKVELFRQAEAERMNGETPTPQDLAFHKELLTRLITDGEHLLRLIDQHGFLENSERITSEDLQATLDNLRADYRGWHTPMSAPEREQVLREVFDGSKSGH